MTMGEAELFYGPDPLLEEGKFYEKVLVNVGLLSKKTQNSISYHHVMKLNSPQFSLWYRIPLYFHTIILESLGKNFIKSLSLQKLFTVCQFKEL